MSRSLLHDWEYDIERCCRDNLPCEMKELIEDIYNTAYERGKNSQEPVLGKIRAEIDQQEKWLLQAGINPYNVDIAFDAIKSAVTESEVVE